MRIAQKVAHIAIGALLVLTGIIMIASRGHAVIDPDSIVGLWLFDDGKGDAAKDSSGNKRHGAFTGTPKWRKGKFGESLELGGNGGTVEIPGFAQGFPTEEVTITLWVKVAGSRNQDLFSLVPSEPGRITVHMPWEDNVLWQFGTPFVEVRAPIEDVRDKWHHWAFIHSVANNVMLVYQNGEEVRRQSASKAYANRAGSFHIGGRPDFSFQGFVDEVGLFASVLSQDDIKSIMENGIEKPALASVSPVSKLSIAWGKIKLFR